ncbi:MAG: hypothetical protein WCC69_06920 [Pirellulales bacterium]
MFHRTWFAPFVIVFWLVTSGWLITAKILPQWQPGSPPGYQGLYGSGGRLGPVGWTVQWNGSPLGWALAESTRTPEGGLTVESRLHFERLPVEEVLPSWASTLVTGMLRSRGVATFDARGRLAIDSDGRLNAFRSAVSVAGMADDVVLEGTVRDGDVAIDVRAGELHYQTRRHLPDQLTLGDELSPQSLMPGLYEGRRWTVPVYSPLRSGLSPLEIMHAEVGPEETLFWDNNLVRVHVVSYRDDPSSSRPPRSRLWVDRSGRVLKQESMVLAGTLVFVRRSDDDAARLAAEAAEEAAGIAEAADSP